MFADRLVEGVRRCGTPLCVGLDPVLERLPVAIVNSAVEHHGSGREGAAAALAEFSGRVLDALAGTVPAVKVQAACFELYGAPGVAAMEEVIGEAREMGYLVVGDLKRGDIGASSRHYARAWLGGAPLPGDARDPGPGLDAMTVSPYLGPEGIEPFLEAARRQQAGLFVLVATSNPGAELVQNAGPEGGRVYELLAREVHRWGTELTGASGYSSIGAVVGATRPQVAGELRQVMPHAFFLVPGLGAQGASPRDLEPFFNADGLGALVTVSRSLIFAQESRPGRELEDAVRDEAEALRRALATVADVARPRPHHAGGGVP
jgi:orotidine-5'-phosphate decarboxylase